MMNDQLDLSRGRGFVRLDTGIVTQGFNLITYQGGDIIAQLVSGNVAYKIAAMWFEFQNSTPSGIVASRTDTAATVRAALSTTRDIVRAQMVAQPLLTASDVNHQFNQAQFTAVTTATVGLVNGLAFSSGAGSKVYAVDLVATPISTGAPTDYLGDLIYARWIVPTPAAVTTGQVSCSWITQAL